MGRMMGGGVESTVMNHYRHLDHSRVQFDFVVDDDSTVVPRAEIASLGGRVFTVPSYAKLPSYVQSLHELFAERHPNIVHSNINSLSVFPLGVAAQTGVPVRVAHSHSMSSPGEGAKTAVKMTLRPFSRMFPTDYAACSNAAARWLFGGELVDEGKVHLIRNAIDIGRFTFRADAREAKRAELGVDRGQLVIGQVGRLCFQKNQMFSLAVFASFLKVRPDAVLVLVGGGDMMKDVRDRIRELGIERSVRMLGVRNDVNDLYQAFDVLMFPSTYEGLGMAAIEAQTAGLPVIASDEVPREAAIVPGLTRFLPLTGNDGEDAIGQWVDALRTITPDGGRVNEAEPVRAAGYDIADSAIQLCDWYERLVDKARR